MNSDIQEKFNSYPIAACRQLEIVRKLLLTIAAENELGEVDESLKWGEASYHVKGGSPVRIDWLPKDPDAIRVFFHCQTRLVDTFKEVYRNEFEYEGNRAIVIPLSADLEQAPLLLALSHCIRLALKYHSLKHLPLLGA
ncbi:DUF1801 domain-containing protein [Nitrincola alkalilacustris]|uniref:DUF1801 domain-containing protein n=1 Tax=Nitrincola alkalilacustris TaxID=1571224 RepID=UPI00124D3DEE|nr:DUF1801 domain-containing protein [Nitrincola alkalilacustris]